MKALLFFFSLCSLSMLFSSTEEKPRNINIILHLNNDVSEEEQEVYLWSFCTWISNSEQVFWDSAKIEKGQKIVKLQGYAPYDQYFNLGFSKNGPQKLYVYAQPEDTIEIHISANDRNVHWKNATKGSYHNVCTDYMNATDMDWIKWREAPKDSVSYYSHILIDYYTKHLHETKHPQLAHQSCSMLQMFFKDYLGNDSIQKLREYVAQKFSDFPPAVLNFSNPPLSERSKRTKQRLNEIFAQRKKYEKSKQSTETGSKLELKLPAVNGETISLTDLKSKYIFLDIWASWCKPCRAQVPYLKAVLKKYQKDLIIYAVSIDTNHSAWRKAIEQDKTQEFIHVIGSDEQRKKVKAVEVLGIERIPRNFLLDRNCRIIAKDLHDEQLMQTLDSLERQ